MPIKEGERNLCVVITDDQLWKLREIAARNRRNVSEQIRAWIDADQATEAERGTKN